MKKPGVILIIAISVLVVAFLLHDVVQTLMASPCQDIFQQTRIELDTRLSPVKGEGNLSIGQEQLSHLSAESEMMATRMKTCCIALNEGRINSQEFITCESSMGRFEADLEKAVAALVEANAARQQNQEPQVSEKLAQVDQLVEKLDQASRRFDQQVIRYSKRPPLNKPAGRDDAKPNQVKGEELEPNNTPFEANRIGLGVEVLAEIPDNKDIDYFLIRNESGFRDWVKIQQRNRSTTLAPHFTVYNDKKVKLFTRYDGTPGADVEGRLLAEPGQDYYVRVDHYQAPGAYRLRAELQQAYDGQEPNDSAAEATVLTAGSPVDAGILDKQDEDWYRLTATRSGEMTVRFVNVSETLAPYVTVFNDAKSKLLGKYDSTPGADLTFTFEVSDGKEYYLQVPHYQGAGAYRIGIEE